MRSLWDLISTFFFKDKRIRDKLSWIFQKDNFVYAEIFIFILSGKKKRCMSERLVIVFWSAIAGQRSQCDCFTSSQNCSVLVRNCYLNSVRELSSVTSDDRFDQMYKLSCVCVYVHVRSNVSCIIFFQTDRDLWCDAHRLYVDSWICGASLAPIWPPSS